MSDNLETAISQMDEAGKTALLILDAIIQMSDRAEGLGGATCISGVAALNTMQRSIQKNKGRIVSALAKARDAA